MKTKTKTAACLALTILCLITGCSLNRPGMESIENNISNDGEDNIVTMEIPDYSEYVTLWDYSDYQFPVTEEYMYDEQDVNDEIQMEINTTFSALTELHEITDRSAQELDTVNISYVGVHDGEMIQGEQGNAENIEIVLGYAGYPDGFEDAIIGMEKGETKETTVTMPLHNTDEDGTDEITEITAVYTITLNNIYRYELPEITDEIAKEYTGYDSYDKYVDILRAAITAEFTSNAYTNLVTAIIQHIIDQSSFMGYPKGKIDGLVEQSVNIALNRADIYEMDINNFLSTYYGVKTMDGYKDLMRQHAEEYMRMHMVICEIARKEGITIPEKLMERSKEMLRTQYGIELDGDLSEYISDEDILYDLIIDPVYKVLASHAVSAQDTDMSEES